MSFASPHARTLLRRALLTGAALAAVALLAAPAAWAESVGEQIVRRCTTAQSLSGFTQAQYKQALEDEQADAEEYSPCAEEIRQAEIAAAAARGSHHGGAAAAEAARAAPLAAAPAELRSLERAKRQGGGPVTVGGQVIHPGVVHADVASALSTLPTPLLAVLALMLACVLVLAGVLARKRIRRGREG
jgi:hypothetical protein